MNDSQQTYRVNSGEEMETLGGHMAEACKGHPSIILLEGDLGAGKTTFTRGFLRKAGYQGSVKSPTFSLLESYELTPCNIIHFDLYRLKNPAELNAIGWSDFFNQQQTCLIEWPEKAASALTIFDIRCIFTILDNARQIQFKAHSKLGENIVRELNEK